MKRAVTFFAPLVAVLAFCVTALAQSGGAYTLAWFSTTSGGASSGGNFVVSSTVGEAAAGQMAGGAFAINGGYLSVDTGPVSTPTATHTPTRSRTPTRTRTPTSGPSPTRTRTPTPGPSPTPTQTQPPGVTPPNECTTRPEKPVLADPPDKAKFKTKRPVLRWNAASCAQTYKVMVKDAVSGSTVDKKGGLTGLEYKTKPLTAGRTYKWFVQACNPPHGCAKSAKFSFSVK